MLARLWWKDARQFLPIWTTVALVALLNHWLFLTYLAEARRGALLVIAFGMTCLYALVVTAAATSVAARATFDPGLVLTGLQRGS